MKLLQQIKGEKLERLIFILYLTGFIIPAMSMALSQPLYDSPPLYLNPPDEHSRFLVPNYICNYGIIPSGLEEEVRLQGYGFSYALYTNFPYIIQGYVMYFVRFFTDSALLLLYAARMVNVAFGIMMAVVVYLFGKSVFSDRRFRWLFCFGVTYLPQNLYIHTYINTDSCCMLSTAMIVYGLFEGYKTGFARKSRLWLEGGIILCTLSYYNAYGYILSSIILFLGYFCHKENGRFRYDTTDMLKKGGLIGGAVLLGCGWSFLRSYIVLDGDLLGLATWRKMTSLYAVESANPLTKKTYQRMGYSILEMMRERPFIERVTKSFVGAYGSMAVWANEWFYRFYHMSYAIGILGALLRAAEAVYGRVRTEGKRIFFHLNMLYCILMPIGLLVYYAYAMDYQEQGRYLLPILVPFLYYVVKGIEKLLELFNKWHRLPDGVVNAVIIAGIFILVCGMGHMVYGLTLPLCLQTGIVLK